MSMSRRIAAISIISLMFGFLGNPVPVRSAPPGGSGRRPVTQPKQVAGVVEGNNHFAFDLYQRLRLSKGNLFFSPSSISTALAMVYAGAAGETRTEMARVLHFSMPAAQLNREMRALLASWQGGSGSGQQGFQLEAANRLWCQEGFKLLPDFLKTLRTDYGAEMGLLDFDHAAEHAQQTINAWVEERTGRRITNLIPSAKVLEHARLVLTNAVYFKGVWHQPFDKAQTTPQSFLLSPGEQADVPLMQKTGHYRYMSNDDLQILQLPYGDGSLSMLILLPTKKDGLAELEPKLTDQKLTAWIRTLGSQNVAVAIPKFKTTSQFGLADTLKSMGITSAFNETADFSGMTGVRDLFLSAVLHKAFVEVNEESTEAAAATGIVMRPTAVRIHQEPLVFRADHPFAFLIHDDRTQSILFLGRIVDPRR
jgi:serpin B